MSVTGTKRKSQYKQVEVVSPKRPRRPSEETGQERETKCQEERDNVPETKDENVTPNTNPFKTKEAQVATDNVVDLVEEDDQVTSFGSDNEESVQGETSDEGETLMGFGKYRDLTFRQVYKTNPGYYKWGKRLDNPSPKLQRFLTWVDAETGAVPSPDTILTVGNYSGKTFSYIYWNDPGYCAWVQHRLETPCKELKEFRDWLAQQNSTKRSVDSYVAGYAKKYRKIWE